MFGELFYNPEHQYKDSGIKGDNAYYNRMAIRPVGIKYAGFSDWVRLITGCMQHIQGVKQSDIQRIYIIRAIMAAALRA